MSNRLKKAVIFGATVNVEMIESIKESYDIVYATDNDSRKHGKCLYDNIMVKNVNELRKGDYDYVVITSITGQNEIYNQLITDYNMEESKIVLHYLNFQLKSRIQFLKSFSQIVYDKNIQGSVCEVGVFRGEFAKEINRFFFDRSCYLFDTFSGFDIRDVEIEKTSGYSPVEEGHLNTTSISVVLSKMKYKENIVIKKGYFPETFDLEDEEFCFVNLDLDLYKPIAEGLKIFWPLLKKGGVILVHDYFHPSYRGVKEAVTEFAKENNTHFIPIGDSLSVALLRM